MRQLAQRLGGQSGLAFVGTSVSIADEFEKLLTEACDGFTITFFFLPWGLDYIVEQLVPELQRRGIFRQNYVGTILRDHLGLSRPANKFFPTRAGNCTFVDLTHASEPACSMIRAHHGSTVTHVGSLSTPDVAAVINEYVRIPVSWYLYLLCSHEKGSEIPLGRLAIIVQVSVQRGSSF